MPYIFPTVDKSVIRLICEGTANGLNPKSHTCKWWENIGNLPPSVTSESLSSWYVINGTDTSLDQRCSPKPLL